MADLVLGDVDLVIAGKLRLDVVDSGLQRSFQSRIIHLDSEDIGILSRVRSIDHNIGSALEHDGTGTNHACKHHDHQQDPSADQQAVPVLRHELTDPFRHLFRFLCRFPGILRRCGAAGGRPGCSSACALACFGCRILLFDFLLLPPPGESIGSVFSRMLGVLTASVQGVGTGVVISVMIDLLVNRIRDQRGCMAFLRSLPAVARCRPGTVYSLVGKDCLIEAELLTGSRLGRLFALKFLSGSPLCSFFCFQFASRRRPDGGVPLAGPSGS